MVFYYRSFLFCNTWDVIAVPIQTHLWQELDSQDLDRSVQWGRWSAEATGSLGRDSRLLAPGLCSTWDWRLGGARSSDVFKRNKPKNPKN